MLVGDVTFIDGVRFLIAENMANIEKEENKGGYGCRSGTGTTWPYF